MTTAYHGGDSDSTGAIAGNHRWLAQVECRDLMAALARDLAHTQAGSSDTLWERYPAGEGVIVPVLTGRDRRTHAAIFSFMAGVTPPMPMLGRSLS